MNNNSECHLLLIARALQSWRGWTLFGDV